MTTTASSQTDQEPSLSAGLAAPIDALGQTAYPIIAMISTAHMLNDMMQSILLAIYPLLKQELQLSFAQIGLITLVYQITASFLQPLVGLYTDRRPHRYSLPIGMGFTLVGLLTLAQATSFLGVLLAAMLIGIGSSIFHPESSRVARMAAGRQPGLSQSLFQIGGNLGSAIGPLLVAWVVMPHGQAYAAWFAGLALLGVSILSRVGHWAGRHMASFRQQMRTYPGHGLSNRQVQRTLLILIMLMFSKFFYMTSLSSYYTFYLIDRFQLSMEQSQFYLFVFLFSVAAGTFLGGPLGDRIGRKKVIWGSILGVAPFTLALPHLDLQWTAVCTVFIGLILASAFPAILVYAQELLPGKVGAVSGLFFGLAFGLGGLGAALLGELADATGIGFVYRLCAYLPLIGLVAVFLPGLKKRTPLAAAS